LFGGGGDGQFFDASNEAGCGCKHLRNLECRRGVSVVQLCYRTREGLGSLKLKS